MHVRQKQKSLKQLPITINFNQNFSQMFILSLQCCIVTSLGSSLISQVKIHNYTQINISCTRNSKTHISGMVIAHALNEKRGWYMETLKTYCHTIWGRVCGTIDRAMIFQWQQGRNRESCRLLASYVHSISYLDSEHFLLFILSSFFTLQHRTHYIWYIMKEHNSSTLQLRNCSPLTENDNSDWGSNVNILYATIHSVLYHMISI
jgi:hypothetical protein